MTTHFRIAALLPFAVAACTLHAEIDVVASDGGDESSSESGPPPQSCDPLVGDCPAEQLCFPEPPGSGEFRCVDDPDPDAGLMGEPCHSPYGCAPTLACVPGDWVEGCPDAQCCTPLCHIDDPMGCLPGQSCLDFPEIAGPEVGVCACDGFDCNAPPPNLGQLFVSTESDGLWRVDLATHQSSPLVPPPSLQGGQDIILGFDGVVYVAEADLDTVHMFDPDGADMGQLFGSGEGGLDSPTGLATNGMRLYIASQGTDQILFVNLPGGPVQALTMPGESGLQQPGDLAIDQDGEVLAVSAGPEPVLRFDAFGGGGGPFISPHPMLQGPTGLAVLEDGSVLVSGRDSHNVLVFDSMGGFAGEAVDPGGVMQPWGLAIDQSFRLYVAGQGMIGSFDIGGPPPFPFLDMFAAPPSSTGIVFIP